ncbi:hypothetical protein M231_04996 [Tremella mesenterica]|uniref:Probable 26S proteasome regulatory subunit p27 n=1 Tax=Tremella mesenterica TaxID=5217 RepID=A0A4V1M3R1_TREME|nr:hypothetical protein M231_04996 [Tremella mesenterica]
MAFPIEHNNITLPLPDPEAYQDDPREYARELMRRKDEIDSEMDRLRDLLTSQGITSGTSLFDPEGFPRNDIDVYSIRHARASLIRLRTDLNQINNLLAPALDAAFSSPTNLPDQDEPHTFVNGSSGNTNSHDSPNRIRNTENGNRVNGDGGKTRNGMINGHDPSLIYPWPDKGLARVDSVASESPAQNADLRAGDIIFSFGGITSTTGSLNSIGALVAGSQGTPLIVLVQRGEEKVQLNLTPRSGWGGRGLLGCHILPL